MKTWICFFFLHFYALFFICILDGDLQRLLQFASAVFWERKKGIGEENCMGRTIVGIHNIRERHAQSVFILVMTFRFLNLLELNKERITDAGLIRPFNKMSDNTNLKYMK